MTPEEVSRMIRQRAAAVGMTPQQYAEAFNALTPEQIKAGMWRRDSWNICNWMQPLTKDLNPDDSRWWASRLVRAGDWEFSPRTLDLDALWEVEERLSESQWQLYCCLMFNLTPARSNNPIEDLLTKNRRALLHATAEEKIRALARVIRETREVAR